MPDLHARAIHMIEALLADPDLDEREVELRGRQLVEHARGIPCAELAFDPLARLLDVIDRGFGTRRKRDRLAWQTVVSEVVERAIRERDRRLQRAA